MGPPGVGKSHVARFAWDTEPYEKMQNKWWDGYDGQEIVILEDADNGGDKLHHHLKTWTDRYATKGETKGGMIPLHYRKFVVTSNYSIERIWGPREGMTQEQKEDATIQA
jgi:hypothetical protein